MSTLSPTRKVSRKHELREDRVVTLYARTLGIIEKNKTAVYGSLIGVVIILALIFGFSYVQSNRNTEALQMMTQAVSRYEQGDYAAAIDGDMSFTGLLDIADEFGSTKAGNLARFYAADALFRMGDLDRALPLFESYEKGDNYLGASALAGEAAIYEARGDHVTAAERYRRAANLFPSKVTSPDYLQKAAREYRLAGNTQAATEAYDQIKEDYPESTEAQNVEFYLAQLGVTE